MDSRTRLDYALFQLTPTRTRCDLVIFAANNSEKLAAGLLEPFLTHLKSAKDEISKGGYSISLTPSPINASWFTKATLQRFLKFVTTPEILERFVTIEREITQIETSLQPNGEGNVLHGDSKFSAAFSKSKGESDDIGEEENPKVRLQRVLESRKAVLRKEQAMTYARALVSGFDMDNLDDLISFANAFGALRLREACIKFMELCNKKRDDGIWMDEVAALQACSPEFSFFDTSGMTEHSDIGLSIRKQNASVDASTSDTLSHASFDTNHDNGSQVPYADGKSQQMWPNNVTPYMQNYQNPAFQQIPPYPGYMYSGMHVAPNYYPGMPWPEDTNWTKKPPSKNKKKYSNESNNSSSNGSSDEYGEDIPVKKHGKSSSRKAVIRNINYIAPKRNGQSESSSEGGSDDEDGFISAGSLKQKVEEAVGSWERHNNSTSHKKNKLDGKKRHSSGNISNGAPKDGILDGVTREANTGQNWDFFQNILMHDADSRSNDTGSKAVHEETFSRQNIGEEKSLRSVITSEEELLFSQRTQELKGYTKSIFPNGATEQVVMKGKKEEDLFVGNLLNKSTYQGKGSDTSIFAGDYASMSHDDHLGREKDKNDTVLDDSIMIQAHSVVTTSDYHQQADIFMVSDIVGAEKYKNTKLNHVKDKHAKPNDLFMVLGKDSSAEKVSSSWNPEMDYENDVFLTEALKSHADESRPADSADMKNTEGTRKKFGKDLGRKEVRKEPKSRGSVGSLGRTKSEISSRTKKSPSISRTTSLKSKADKDEESRKKLEESLKQRQKRIAERSGTPGFTASTSGKNTNKSATSSKIEKPKPQAPTEPTNRLHKPVFKSSTIDRLAATRTAKDRSTESKTAPPSKKPSQKENKVISPLRTSARNESKKGPRKVKSSDLKSHQVKPLDTKGQAKGNSASDSQDVKDGIMLRPNEQVGPESFNETTDTKETDEKKDILLLSAENSKDDKKQSSQLKENKAVKFVLSEVESKTATHNAIKDCPQVTPSSDLNMEHPVCQEVLSKDVSTPPSNTEMNLEINHERRKWITDESSLKVTQGFRKLLFFGRKS